MDVNSGCTETHLSLIDETAPHEGRHGNLQITVGKYYSCIFASQLPRLECSGKNEYLVWGPVNQKNEDHNKDLIPQEKAFWIWGLRCQRWDSRLQLSLWKRSFWRRDASLSLHPSRGRYQRPCLGRPGELLRRIFPRQMIERSLFSTRKMSAKWKTFNTWNINFIRSFISIVKHLWASIIQKHFHLLGT